MASHRDSSKAVEFTAPAEATKMTVNQQHLKQAWDVSQVAAKDDWTEWMHRITVEFMKESPSHALRACMSLVDVHPPLAKELFNAAFLSCWGELYDQYQAGFKWSHTFVFTDCLCEGGFSALFRVRHHIPHRTCGDRSSPP